MKSPDNHFYEQEDQKKPYNFAYNVRDEYRGTDFEQNEESDGNQVTGSYTVLLPDGRKQTVNVTNDNDYNTSKFLFFQNIQ